MSKGPTPKQLWSTRLKLALAEIKRSGHPGIYSRRELAARLGISEQTTWRMEAGLTKKIMAPTLEAWRKDIEWLKKQAAG